MHGVVLLVSPLAFVNALAGWRIRYAANANKVVSSSLLTPRLRLLTCHEKGGRRTCKDVHWGATDAASVRDEQRALKLGFGSAI